ncbi:Tat pathway signal sequence domain protein, partial [Ostertagia ostertagi]
MIKGLKALAKEHLDKWEHGCNISSVVGGVAGIGGGAAVIGGVILMPPVAVAGLAVGGVAAASNMATGLFKLHNLKKNVLAAKEMLESNNIEMREKCATSNLNRETVISSGRVGAVSLAGGAVRLVLKESV